MLKSSPQNRYLLNETGLVFCRKLLTVVSKGLVVLSVLLPLTFSVPEAFSDAQKPISALDEANGLLLNGQIDEAIQKYEEVTTNEPKNAEAFHMLGRALALKGNMWQACEKYEQAVKLANPSAELFNDYGVALAADNRPQEAIQVLRQAIAKNDRFVAAYNNLGVLLEQSGDLPAAYEIFGKSLKIQPKNQYIQKRLANLKTMLDAKNAENPEAIQTEDGSKTNSNEVNEDKNKTSSKAI